MKNTNVFSQEFNDESSLKFFDVQNPESPYDEEGDTSTEDGNSRIASDDCSVVDDEVARDATHIEDNVTSEGNVPVNQNGKGQSSPIGVSPELRRSTRPKVMPARFNDFVVNSSVRYGLEKYVCYNKLSKRNMCFSTTLNKTTEPKTFQEAAQNPKWIEAMNLEMESLFRNNTYVLVDLPPGRKAIGCKWLWKIKYKSSGEVERYKSRLVSKGFGQREGIDYEETCSLVVKMVTVSTKFMIKDLGQLKYFLGIEVLENMNGLCLNQRKYCLELLSEYGLLACKPAATPLQQNVVLGYEESENDKFLPNMTKYQKIVSKLIYLSITRPDISYVVHCLSQHMHAPLQSHFSAALRVLRYLKGAPGTGIQFYKQNSFSLHGFSDADWAKCPKTRKSVSGYCLHLCNNLVVKILKDLGVEGLLPVNLYCDNSSTISIAGNPVFHEKTKHFEIDLHLVRDKVADGVVKVLKVASASNVADVFTKGLSSMSPTRKNQGKKGMSSSRRHAKMRKTGGEGQEEEQEDSEGKAKRKPHVPRHDVVMCDLTVLNDPYGGSLLVETRMTRGVTSLARQDTGMFDMICMYQRNTRDNTFALIRFSMKDMGEADVIFGIRIKHESKGIYISPSHYIEKLEFYGVISFFMYVMTCTRPGITFVVEKLIRFSMKDMGEADVIFGIRIKHESKGIYISPSHYIEKLEFYGVISFLMYVMTFTRPGITLVVEKLISMGKGLLGPKGGSCGGKGGRGGSIAGRGGGWLAKRSIISNDGRSGGGLVVLGGKSSRESKNRCGYGEVKGGGVDLGVVSSLVGEIPGDVMGERGRDTIGM
ncbi:ribonuclease H-like domain-containing protein [Tanacetum coccineum]